MNTKNHLSNTRKNYYRFHGYYRGMPDSPVITVDSSEIIHHSPVRSKESPLRFRDSLKRKKESLVKFAGSLIRLNKSL